MYFTQSKLLADSGGRWPHFPSPSLLGQLTSAAASLSVRPFLGVPRLKHKHRYRWASLQARGMPIIGRQTTLKPWSIT